MEKSWDHAIDRITEEDTRAPYSREWLAKCRASTKCQNPCTHFVWYRYITGQAGRVTTRKKPVCLAHAEAFARKHSVAMPAEEA